MVTEGDVVPQVSAGAPLGPPPPLDQQPPSPPPDEQPRNEEPQHR